MGEEATLENGLKTDMKLDTEVANGIKHAVSTLDESSSGTVSKSQLQALVANVCQAIKISFVSEYLENYLPEKDDLSVSEFLEFLESTLLVKGTLNRCRENRTHSIFSPNIYTNNISLFLYTVNVILVMDTQ